MLKPDGMNHERARERAISRRGGKKKKKEVGLALLIRDKSNITPLVLGETISCKTILARKNDFLTD